jgi:peroxiredoxin
MDDSETLARFKAELKAPFLFIPDPEGDIVGKFDVKTPVVSFAKRYTFVIGEDRKILKVESGSDAINPEGAIVACPIRRPATKAPASASDGGTATPEDKK